MSQHDRLPVDLLAIKNILRDAIGVDAWEVMPNKLRLVHRVVQMAREAHKLGYIGGVLDTTAAVSEIMEQAPRRDKPAAPKTPRIITLDNPADLTGILDHIQKGGSPDTYKPVGTMHDNKSGKPSPFVICGREHFPANWAPVIYEPDTWVKVVRGACLPEYNREADLEALSVRLSNLPQKEYCSVVGSLLADDRILASAQAVLPKLIEDERRKPKPQQH